MTQLDIIAVSGKAGSGKNHLFDHYLRPLGYYCVALADDFKITAIARGLATRDEVFRTKPPHVREALQRTGTEEGRQVWGEDIWCNTVLAWMEHHAEMWGITKFCVTDVRFVNEVEFVQRQGGRVIRIVAPERVAQSPMADKARIHDSETALDTYDVFDGFVVNDPAFIERVPSMVEAALGREGNAPHPVLVRVARERERRLVQEARERMRGDIAVTADAVERELFCDPYRDSRTRSAA